MHRSLRRASALTGAVIFLTMALTACVQVETASDPTPTVSVGTSPTPRVTGIQSGANDYADI